MSSTIDYTSGNIPMVGLAEADNLAYFGGCTINERWKGESAELDHFVFVTNVIDYLHDSSDLSGPVVVDGVVNPDAGDYFATETLAGDDTHSVDPSSSSSKQLITSP